MENRVAEKRAEKKITQVELAERCGIGQSTVAEIEGGKHSPTVEVAIRIARALETTVEALFIVP